MPVVDGFEDGDIAISAADWSGWTGDTASFSAQQSTVLAGSRSGELEAVDANVSAIAARDSATTSALTLSVQANALAGPNDFFGVLVRDGSGTRLFYIVFNDAGSIDVLGGSTIRSSWSTDTAYTIEFDFDFASNEADISINGTVEGTFAFENAASDWTDVEVRNATTNNSTTRSVVVDDVVEGALPAEPVGLSATAQSDSTVDLAWSNAASYDELRVYRDTSPGVRPTAGALVATITDGTSTAYTDASTAEGVEYHYAVSGVVNGVESALSGEGAATTVLPAPSNCTVDSTGSRELDVSWAEQSTDEAGYRVETSTDGGGTWTTTATVGSSTTSATLTGLQDGEKYAVRVTAYTADAESAPSNTDTGTTTLPDAAALQADASVEDELTASVTDVLNYGQYRWQYRVTGSGNNYTDEGTTGESTPSKTITGLLDGEQYDIRARTETEHATGAWTVISPVTLLPAPSNPTVESSSQTSVTVSWTDNADNEGTYRLVREELVDGAWTAEAVVATEAVVGPETLVGPQTVVGAQATDSTPRPGTTYRYRARAVTEHATADSPTVTVTTTPLAGDPPQTTIPTDGWYVEVDHADGTTRTPRVLDGATRRPTVNGLPRLDIPVPQDDTWRAEGFDQAPVRVWKDGRRQPVDELARVRQEPERSVLEAVGATQLQRRVTTEVSSQPAHELAEDLILAETGYAANVDDPAAATTNDYLMQMADSSPEWESVLAGAPFAADDPRTVESGVLRSQQTAYYKEGEDAALQNTAEVFGADRFAQGQSARVSALDDAVSTSWTFDHEIPSGNADVALRLEYSGSTHPGFEIRVNGSVVNSFSADQDFTNLDLPTWFTFDVGFGLAADTSHSVEVYCTGPASDSSYLYVDALSLGDDRYTSWGNEDLTSGGTLSSPALYPDSLDVETVDANAVETVVAGELTSTWNDTSNNQQVAISNDQGATYITADNTTSVSGSFASGSAQIRARFRLSNYNGGGPVELDSGQTVDLYDLYADLDDTPLAINQTWDAPLVDVLADLADQYDFVWQAVRDPSASGGYRIEWTQPGQRSSTTSTPLEGYDIQRDQSIVTKAVIYGVAQTVRDERFTADHGTAVSLDQQYLVPASERVYDPDTGTTFVQGDDYEMSFQSGEVTALATGALADGTEYAIDYEWRLRDSYALPSHSGDPRDEFVETLPAAHSERACGQAALAIVRDASSPRVTASVDLSERSGEGWLLVDELDIDGLPAEPLEVYSIDASGGGQTLQLGSRETIEEEFSRIRSRLESTSSRV